MVQAGHQQVVVVDHRDVLHEVEVQVREAHRTQIKVLFKHFLNVGL